MGVTAPERLTPEHDLSEFDCDSQSLNEFLTHHAIKNMASRATITYVVCRPDTPVVVGYFSICPGAVDRSELPGKYKRKMPNPVPVMVLARLAVDESLKGNGVGEDLLQASVKLALEHSRYVGATGLMVNALPDAVDFYLKYDFDAFPKDPSKLIMSLIE